MPDALSDEELAEFVKKYVLPAITTLYSRLTPIVTSTVIPPKLSNFNPSDGKDAPQASGKRP